MAVTSREAELWINWSDEQLAEAGIPRRRLIALVRKLRECSAIMQELKMEVYGSDGVGYLIHESRPTHKPGGVADMESQVARIGYGFNGGGW